eukprot:COSAG02_NODE_3058_length_7451_cov_47.724701_8_plen_67_part_00
MGDRVIRCSRCSLSLSLSRDLSLDLSLSLSLLCGVDAITTVSQFPSQYTPTALVGEYGVPYRRGPY